MNAGSFRLKPGKVVDETIDGEVIIIQLELGTYFSLGGSGAEVWELLRAGHGQASVAETLRARYPGQAQEIEPAIASLLDQLVSEQVIEPDPDAPAAAVSAQGGVADGGFEPPALERYDDMQDFLLLDPIHEVHETGWPKPGLG